MTAHKPWFEVVHTGPYQFHARFRARNGEIVWTTESYRRRIDALRAIALIWDESKGDSHVRHIDERAS